MALILPGTAQVHKGGGVKLGALARGGAHKVYEGDWIPRRIVLFEFPSMEELEKFYYSDVYQGLKAIRDECSSGRVVSVEGI